MASGGASRPVFCGRCGNRLQAQVDFCSQCGQRAVGGDVSPTGTEAAAPESPTTVVAAATPPPSATSSSQGSRERSKRPIALGALGGLLAVALLVGVVNWWPPSGRSTNAQGSEANAATVPRSGITYWRVDGAAPDDSTRLLMRSGDELIDVGSNNTNGGFSCTVGTLTGTTLTGIQVAAYANEKPQVGSDLATLEYEAVEGGFRNPTPGASSELSVLWKEVRPADVGEMARALNSYAAECEAIGTAQGVLSTGSSSVDTQPAPAISNPEAPAPAAPQDSYAAQPTQAGLGCAMPQGGTDFFSPEETLCLYFEAINERNWQRVCYVNEAVPCEELIEGSSSSTWSNVSIFVHYGGGQAIVRGRSTQPASKGPDGETCTDWTLNYNIALVDSPIGTRTVITSSTGGRHTPC